MEKSKVVFCGFGKLGKDCLVELQNKGYIISFILTHREKNIESVDTFAEKSNIPYSYVDLRKHNASELELIFHQASDLLISINYRYILEKKFFSRFKYAINLHGALLPKYRGRTPHVWSIINGEKYSGVTAHIIDEIVDAGDIVKQIKIKIEDEDTGFTLLEKFQKIYPELLIDALSVLKFNGKLEVQNSSEASYFGKRIPDMGYIDFYKEANEVINFVRAQAPPYPGAYYYLPDGQKIYIDKISEHVEGNLNISIGIIKKTDDEFYVNCKNGLLKIVEYRLSGGI